MKKIFISLLAFNLLFISCDNEAETLNSSTEKSNSEAVTQRSSGLENVLNSFAVNQINISNEISNLVNQNKNVDFSKISFESLENSKSENELKISLESAGIANSDLLIIALKKQINNFNQNLALNKEFLSLTEDEKKRSYLRSNQ